MRALLSRRSPTGDLRGLADEELLVLVAEGDARAFEVVFDRHADAAFSHAYRICGRSALAEEIVQEAFLSMWRASERYDRARGSVRSWALAVVHNRAIDVLRTESARTRRDVVDEAAVGRLAAPDSTESEVERRDDASRVRGAMSALPRDQRQVVELSYFGGFTHTEIADMLSLPPGTVKGRMRLALTKLRGDIGELSPRAPIGQTR